MNQEATAKSPRYEPVMKAIEGLREVLKFIYLAHAAPHREEFAVLFEKTYDGKDAHVPFQALQQQVKDLGSRKEIFTLKIKKDQAEIHCCISPLSAWKGAGCIVMQKDSEFTENDIRIITAFSQMMSAALVPDTGAVMNAGQVDGSGAKPLEGESTGGRFRSEILNMRYIQATLFPEFSDVSGFDIGSAFFPSEHLSGNFIDGFFLDKTIYQFAFCTISAKGIQSSFVGSAIRTLLRTQSQVPGVPSAVITEVNSKLSKIISGVKFLASIIVIQINTRTGNAFLSSTGGQPVLLYHRKKNRLISPQGERPQVGGVAEDVYRDLSIQMEPGDSLLLYTGGILEESSEPAGEKYGEQRLMENYLKVAESASREIVRSVAESVYEFINYSRQKDDIIIINIKKS